MYVHKLSFKRLHLTLKSSSYSCAGTNVATLFHVEDVVVDIDFQGKGLGRQMMNYAAEVARQLGGEKLVLSSGKARTNAHEFYEHLGYKKDGYRFSLKL